MKFKIGDRVLDKRKEKRGILESNKDCALSEKHDFGILYENGSKNNYRICYHLAHGHGLPPLHVLPRRVGLKVGKKGRRDRL